MSDLRKEFEALPEISKRLDSLELNDLIFINGAWYAFQEKQRQIDAILSVADKFKYSSGERIYNEIKELLK